MNNEIYPSRTAIASVLYALTAQGQTFNQLIEKTGLSRKVLRQILSLFLDESTVFINTKGGVEYFYMISN
jgi:arsenate reductase-like glutaredoxin family protein